MQLHSRFPSQATSARVLAIGNFDGLHLGHRALLERLTAHARRLNLPAAVMTFEPHPRELFTPDQAPARLTSLREKLALLESCGIEEVFLLRFSRKLAGQSAQEFIDRVLVHGLAVRHLIIGDDFRFGKGRAGDFAMLQAAGQQHGFGVEAMHTIEINGERVSSSAVRDALAVGDLEHAARLLGRPYSIAGRVVHGGKIGRKLGYPTANIQLKRKRVALTGVFAAAVTGIDKRHGKYTGPPQVFPGPLGGESRVADFSGEGFWPGAASLGVRPTLGLGLRPVLEVHLFDFDRDIYGAHLTVHFLHKLRDEARFDSFEALTAQIDRDVAQTQAYFAGKPLSTTIDD